MKEIVKAVYEALRVTEKYVANNYDYVQCILPEEIRFITTQELEDKWPDLDAHQREYEAAKEYGAIRVDEYSLREQLEKAGCQERAELPFQKAILDKKLPYTVGGGIGQSRICMFFLRKCHIGEVQCSIWLKEDIEYAAKKGITIL